MLLLGDAIEIISNIYTLTSDVSKNGSILIDVPNVTSFYCGFKYHIDGSSGRLITKIGDISNNIIIDISHNELLDSNLIIKYNDIIVKDVSLNSMFYDISDVPFDIKLVDGSLNVIINNIDISANILVSEYQNNTFTIQGITNNSQNTIHLIKDIFFDPINVLEDDIFLKRGIYANRYFNVNYDDILNKPWMNIGFDDVYFGGGNVGIGTYVPLSGLDLWGNASIKGNLDISGHILPVNTLTYDLGSNDYRWRDIYLSGNTIDLNGTKLSKHTNGNLMVHDTSGTMLGVTMDHIDLSGTIIRRHTDGSVVLDNGSGERVTGRFGDLDVSGNANVSGNISGVNITGTQLISNIASGTAPLTVTSTTLVTNLNADLLDGLDNTKFMRTDTNTSSTGTISSSSTITGTRLISNIASGTAPLTVTSTTIVTNLNADLLEGLNPSQFMRTDTNTSSTGTLSSSSTITGTQLISNIASGTAPLTVSSSTLVTNLNADLLDNLDSTHYLNYNNLTNKPTIPAAQVNADWNAASGVAQILNKPSIPASFNGGTITNQLTINYTSPTINFQDTDNDSAFLHCNSNILYVLRGGTNATTWTQVNGQWPWEFNLSNNNSKCGGSLNVIGSITSSGATINGLTSLAIDMWHTSTDGYGRLYYANNGTTFYKTRGAHVFRDFRDYDRLYISADGEVFIYYVNGNYLYYYGDKTQSLSFFTGQHRSFTEDPKLFKNATNYKGLIVVSTGKYISEDGKGVTFGKSAISIDDSMPVVKISHQPRQKSVYGVISKIEEGTERESVGDGMRLRVAKGLGEHRLIINSLGEGAIWLCDAGGVLENGDFIVTSCVPGYGMKQDDDIMRNFTVAKITMDCDFNPLLKPKQRLKQEEVVDASGNTKMVNVLDSNGMIQIEQVEEMEFEYDMRYLLKDGTIIIKEIYEEKILNGEEVYKAAFVGCTYHCG